MDRGGLCHIEFIATERFHRDRRWIQNRLWVEFNNFSLSFSLSFVCVFVFCACVHFTWLGLEKAEEEKENKERIE